jgi:hypothetical protein
MEFHKQLKGQTMTLVRKKGSQYAMSRPKCNVVCANGQLSVTITQIYFIQDITWDDMPFPCIHIKL